MAETSLDPDVQYALLNGQEKASLLLSLLGTKSSQLIFQHLKDNDVKRLIGLMADTKKTRTPVRQVAGRYDDGSC